MPDQKDAAQRYPLMRKYITLQKTLGFGVAAQQYPVIHKYVTWKLPRLHRTLIRTLEKILEREVSEYCIWRVKNRGLVMLISKIQSDHKHIIAVPLLDTPDPVDLPQGKHAAPHSVPVNVFGQPLHLAFFYSSFISIDDLEINLGKLEPQEVEKIDRGHMRNARFHAYVVRAKKRRLSFFLEE